MCRANSDRFVASRATVSALEQVFDDLVAMNSSANVALSFFGNDNTCGVQSSPSVPLAPVTPAQVASLKIVLDNTVPSGGTSLVGATTLGYSYLHQEAGAAPVASSHAVHRATATWC